jgi:hypothetical protein
MKNLLLVLLFTILAFSTKAQDIIGAWRLISVKGTEPDGRSFMFDRSMIKETRIITSTNYIMITEDAKSDSIIVNQCSAGDVTIKGNQYEETPTTSTLHLTALAKATFVWAVKNNILTMIGDITLGNGQKVHVNEARYKRIQLAPER